MAKSCLHCDRPVFSNKCCKFHQHLREDTKYIAQKNKVKKVTPIKSSGKPIKKVSTKRQKENKEYLKERIAFLSKPENKYCKVYPELEATEIHHMAARDNLRLLDTSKWLAVSRSGHQFIEMNPEIAYKNKWSLSRLGINE